MTHSSASASTPAIEFVHVTKQYAIQKRASPRVGAWVLNKLFEHFYSTPYNALQDVSFTVPKGQCVGLLGQNGAGKSTTLKLMAGITQPTSGQVHVRGRIASLLELGVGFHPELSGMENIFYNAIMMGLSREAVLQRLERIIQFSGLHPNFLLEPVKHYSSGMYSRLACSVALHLEADVLLIDEILSVGDAGFQQKGMMRILELNNEGCTVVLVSHIVTTMREMCHRLLWVRDGVLVADGDSPAVEEVYRRFMKDLSYNQGHMMKHVHDNPPTESLASLQKSAPRILAVDVEPLGHDKGIEPLVTEWGYAFVVSLDWPGSESVPVKLAITACWADGRILFYDESEELKSAEPFVRYEIPRWPFLSNAVHISVAVLHSGTGQVLHRKIDALVIRSKTEKLANNTRAVFVPDTKWSIEQLSASAPKSNNPDLQTGTR